MLKHEIKDTIHWAIVALIAIFLLLIVFGISRCILKDSIENYASDYADLQLYVKQNEQVDKIKIWESEEGIYYFFLPSYVNEHTVVNLGNLAQEDSVSFNQEVYVSKNNLMGNVEWNVQYDMHMKVDNVILDKQTVVFLKSENIPSVYIETESGSTDIIHNDRVAKEQAKLKIRNKHGELEYDNKIEYVKTRGNSSFDETNKKSYQLKLYQKSEVLGMDESEKWLLISNFVDNSLVKNQFIYNFAREYTDIPTVEGTPVDLYVNNEYRGNYFLCEKIEVDEKRLNIENLEVQNEAINAKSKLRENAVYQSADGRIRAVEGVKSPTDITGGYLIQISSESSFEQLRAGFKTERGYVYEVVSPENATREEVEYICGLFNEFESSIYQEDGINPQTGKHFSEYIAVESWAIRYLIEEVFHNPDGKFASVYFYKDKDEVDSLIYAGPLWDYDRSLGSYGASICYIDRPQVMGFYSLYAEELMKHGLFADVVKYYFKELLQPYVEKYAKSDIWKLADEISASATMNKYRWTETRGYQDSFEASVEYNMFFLQDKVAYLEEIWLQDEIYHTITFLDYYGDTYEQYTVRHGEQLDVIPEINTYAGIFNGWKSVDTGKLLDISIPILEDTTYQAEWIEASLLVQNGVNIAGINVDDIDLEDLISLTEAIKMLREKEEGNADE